MSADLGTSLRLHLVGRPAIAAVVAARIYPDHLPQGTTLPAIVYQVVTQTSEQHLQGLSGIDHARVQIDAYASTRRAANDLAALLRVTLPGLRGAIASGADQITVTGVQILESLRHDAEQPTDGSDEWRYLASQDYKISFRSPTS